MLLGHKVTTKQTIPIGECLLSALVCLQNGLGEITLVKLLYWDYFVHGFVDKMVPVGLLCVWIC